MNTVPESSIESLFTLSQVSKFLNISLRQLYRIIAEGKIPVVKIGKRSPRVRRGDLQNYVNCCTIRNGD
jgi:excisionase family DNA binding protein